MRRNWLDQDLPMAKRKMTIAMVVGTTMTTMAKRKMEDCTPRRVVATPKALQKLYLPLVLRTSQSGGRSRAKILLNVETDHDEEPTRRKKRRSSCNGGMQARQRDGTIDASSAA
jgi:hypothetical protein